MINSTIGVKTLICADDISAQSLLVVPMSGLLNKHLKNNQVSWLINLLVALCKQLK
jgi:hypothetical protein